MDRDEHVAGLQLDRLTPGDIDYFFRTVAPRVPRGTSERLRPVLQVLRGRIQQLAVDLGKTTAASNDPSDIESNVQAVIDQIAQMKRRHWRGRLGDHRIIDHVRHQVGEISADLHELGAS